MMKEKELRLAVVLFGGVSLAIYQHGINREILNLVRASKICHQDKGGKASGPFPSDFHYHYPDEPCSSTGDVYIEFLEGLRSEIDLRVVVDVVAGSSAGGINGVSLATALAHDLSLRPLTELWLAEADLLNLLSPAAKARLWNKWYVRPLLPALFSRLEREGFLLDKATDETKERISAFLRSRWFRPPLDGRHLSRLILDGLAAMTKSGSTSESLLPTNTRLDLIVTVTDFRGLERAIFLHDPAVIQEKDHRLLLHFSLDHRRTAQPRSDFDEDSLPSLAFAARSSASFPGAFPPAQLSEMDSILTERRMAWPARKRFLEHNFRRYLDCGANPEDAVLIDGSVLDNKPIIACIQMILTHGSMREVDRRLVFIDPRPSRYKASSDSRVPGFFATLRAALSDLPRHNPVFNELAVVSRHNRQARRLKTTIANARGHITRMIEQSTAGRIKGNFTASELRHWRIASLNLLSGTAIVYDAWMRSLVLEAIDFVVQIINGVCQYAPESREAGAVQTSMEEWAKRQEIIVDSYYITDSIYENVDLPLFARFILNFGVIYKKRRMNFILYEINGLYQDIDSVNFDSAQSNTLDLLKIKIQRCLDELSIYDGVSFLSRQAIDQCRKLFFVGPNELAAVYKTGDEYFSKKLRIDEISSLVERLNQECDLERVLNNTEAILASPLLFNLMEESRVAILTAYLGYFYWDILLRPTISTLPLEAGPIEEILVDRISPEDATVIRLPTGKGALLGAALGGFGGFLGRPARENDYLWGRLHAIDRLFDILYSTMPVSLRERLDINDLKKRAFQSVVDEETAQLTCIPQLLAELKEAILRI